MWKTATMWGKCTHANKTVQTCNKKYELSARMINANLSQCKPNVPITYAKTANTGSSHATNKNSQTKQTETARQATPKMPPHLRHPSEHQHGSEDKVQVLRVLLHRVELEDVVAREGVEVQALDRSRIEHDERELLDAVGVVRIAQLDPQALEAEGQKGGRGENKNCTNRGVGAV